MKEYRDIFAEEIEVPDIVLQKAEDAFAAIKAEDNKTMINKRKFESKRRNRFFRRPAIAAAYACIFALTGITSAAAVLHFWSRGTRGTVQATELQQQALTDQGMAIVLHETESGENLAVTDGAITVAPETVIADDKFAYLSFRVSGFTVDDNMEPGFRSVNAYLGDDPAAADSWVNMSARFYDGIISNENGSPVYDDGTPLKFNENGGLISHYADENGDMEYIISISLANLEDTLLGKTLHVDFKDMGTVCKAEYTNTADGAWNFMFTLPDKSAAVKLPVDKAVSGTDFTMDTIELSPISIKINYTNHGEIRIHEDENGVPDFCGLVLKDGTKFPYLWNGGGSGYTDTEQGTAYATGVFNRVIEPEKVAAVLVSVRAGADMLEIPISK